MKEGFFITLSFEDGFKCINEALQEIKLVIFKTPVEPIAWVQPHSSTHLHHALECYNVTTEEGEELPGISLSGKILRTTLNLYV